HPDPPPRTGEGTRSAARQVWPLARFSLTRTSERTKRASFPTGGAAPPRRRRAEISGGHVGGRAPVRSGRLDSCRHHGDVVEAAVLVGEADELFAHGVEVFAAAGDVGDLLVGDHAR